MISLSARISTQLVFPPYRTVDGPGVGIDPRTPQNLMRAADVSESLIGNSGESATQMQCYQAFSEKRLCTCATDATNPMPYAQHQYRRRGPKFEQSAQAPTRSLMNRLRRGRDVYV